MDGKIKYKFSAKMWKHSLPAAWHFVSLPKKISKEIRAKLQWQEEGWGRMKAYVEIGAIGWETAIWFDTKMDSYILPVKAEIRKKTKLEINQKIEINIWV